MRRFQRQSLLLRWNQRPLSDATPMSPCLSEGVCSGQGRGVGAQGGTTGGVRFSGVICGPHHEAGVLLVVRRRGKWRPGQEEKTVGNGERQYFSCDGDCVPSAARLFAAHCECYAGRLAIMALSPARATVSADDTTVTAL